MQIDCCNKNSPLTKILLWIAILAPFFLCIIYVKQYAVNTLLVDDYGLLANLRDFLAGKYSVVDMLFRQINEHRAGLPYGLLLLSATFTHYNTALQSYVGLFFLEATAALMLAISWQRFKTAGVSAFALIPVAWLILTLKQTSNLLYSIQLIVFMSVFFLVLALYLLDGVTKIGWRFWGAALAGLGSAFSFSNGLAALPLGAAMLAAKLRFDHFLPKASARSSLLFAWCLASLAVLAAFFWRYSFISSAGRGATTAFIRHHPGRLFEFFLAFLGNPFANDLVSSASIGFAFIVICLLFFAGLVKDRPAFKYNLVLPMAFIGYALLSATVAAFTRVATGMETSYGTRYVTFSLYGWVGLYVAILAAQKLNKSLRLFLAGAIISCFLVGAATTFLVQRDEALGFRNFQLGYANIAKNYKLQGPEALWRVSELDAKQTISILQFLERNKLSVFSQPAKTLAGVPCFGASPDWATIDRVNDAVVRCTENTPLISLDSTKVTDIFLQGWAVNSHTKKPTGDVFVSVDEKLNIPSTNTIARRDVANAFDKESMLMSGFLASCRLNLIGKGIHNVRLKIIASDGRSYLESPVLLRLNII